MVVELARSWVAGWVVSRGCAAPLEEPWGLRVEVGLPNHMVRHVLPAADETTVRSLAATISTPGTWIKAFVPPQSLGDWLDADWTPSERTFLMSTQLRPAPVGTRAGYTLGSETRDGVTRLRVTAADGSLAARGQVATVGTTAVVDQIVTEPAHQRRGLGTLVMDGLANTALSQGATVGVLGASVQGRALYESLGWTVRAPLAGYVSPLHRAAHRTALGTERAVSSQGRRGVHEPHRSTQGDVRTSVICSLVVTQQWEHRGISPGLGF